MAISNIQFPVTNSPYSTGAAGGYTQTQQQATIPLKPQEKIELFEQNNQQAPITVLLDLMGQKGIVAGPENGHYEASRRSNLVKFASLVVGGNVPGAVGTYNISADSFFQFTPPGGSLTTGCVIVEGDIIEFKTAGRPTARVQSVTGTQAVLAPTLASTTLNSIIVFGDNYTITGNAFADATGVPAAKAERIFKYSNTFQLVKNSAASSGRGLATQPYFQALGGQDTPMLERALKLALANHEEEVAKVFYTGKQISNITSPANNFVNYSMPVTGTQGLIPYMEAYSQQDTYPIGFYTIENLLDVTSYLEGERPHTKNYMVIQGFQAAAETWRGISDFAQGFSASGLDVITTSGETISLQNITTVSNMPGTNFSFAFYTEQLFSDARGLGAAGYPYKNLNLFLPMGTTTDAVTKNPTSLVGYDVMGFSGYVRENVIQKLDGSGYTNMTTLANDFHQAWIMSDIAGHFACANQMVIQKGA
jgi:hypothetical protein